MKNVTDKLEAEIAHAVSLILGASRAAAIEALNEAFGIVGQGGTQKDAGVATQRLPSASRRSSSPSKRSAAEISALENRFFDAVLATPGEPMSVLALRVDAKPSALQVPVARLKAAGRLKTVGLRQFTRYFPVERSEAIDRDAAA